jgi:hypothetical protein
MNVAGRSRDKRPVGDYQPGRKRMRRWTLVTAAFGALIILIGTEAHALDCAALSEVPRTLKMTSVATINGTPMPARGDEVRIERDGSTTVSGFWPDGRVLFRTELEGTLGRWTESYPQNKPYREVHEYFNGQGPRGSLDEGAMSSWDERTTVNGNVIIAATASQTIGAHGTTTLSDCPIATVAIHRERVNEASKDKTTLDFLFAPELGYWIASTIKIERAATGTSWAATFKATALAIEK